MSIPNNRWKERPARFRSTLYLTKPGKLEGYPASTRRWLLPLYFFIYGLVVVPTIAYVTPPYQVSDELSHFQRADMVSLGEWVGERRETVSGGVVSAAIGKAVDVFWPLVLHPERRTTPDMFDKAAAIGWDGGKDYQTFENTAIYPPIFYLPSAAGIKIGKATGLSVVQTLYLSRDMTGLVAVVIGTIAIALAGSGALWIFALLTLPMALSSMASVSQEALLLATAALAAGLYISNIRQEQARRHDFPLLCIALAAIATGRLPYAALALLPLAVRNAPLRTRLVGSGSVLAVAFVWSVITAKYAYVKYGIGTASAPDQLAFLLAHPGRIPGIIRNTFSVDGTLLLESFVGRLGWLDLWLPASYIVAAWIVLGAAAFCVAGLRRSWSKAAPFITGGAVSLSFGAIFAALYLSWCPVGFDYAGGAQGRYFIPLALFLPAILPPPPRRQGTAGVGGALARAATLARGAVLTFPIVSFVVVLAGLADRYYRPVTLWPF